MPKEFGTMLPKITPLPNGEYHVELDWRAGKTGHFTKHDLMRLAVHLLDVVDPTSIQELRSFHIHGRTRSWLAHCCFYWLTRKCAGAPNDIPKEKD